MFSCTQERRERHMVSFIVKDLERYPMGKNSYLIVNSKDVPIWYNRIKGSYWVGPFYEDLIQSPFGFSFLVEMYTKLQLVRMYICLINI